jgi:hypothetical protein
MPLAAALAAIATAPASRICLVDGRDVESPIGIEGLAVAIALVSMNSWLLDLRNQCLSRRGPAASGGRIGAGRIEGSSNILNLAPEPVQLGYRGAHLPGRECGRGQRAVVRQVASSDLLGFATEHELLRGILAHGL